MLFRGLGILCFSLLLSVHALALSPPADTETTSVLPNKVKTLRFKQYFVTAEDSFNSGGLREPLGKALNQNIGWKDILNQQQGVQKDLLKASLVAQGIDLEGEGPGAITGEINMAVDVKVPILGYGLSDRQSLGLIVPIYTMKSSYASSFVTTKTGEKWYSSIASPSTKKQIKDQLENASKNLLASYNYKPIQSEKVTALGDIILVHKALISERPTESGALHRFLIRSEIAAPTGKEPDADKVVDLSTGDGQWDIGTGFTYEYITDLERFKLPLSYAVTGFYNYQMADSLERRIPIAEGSSLSPDKEVVNRKLGDEILLGTSMSLGSGRDGSSFSMGYYYQYMLPTSFSGSRYESQRYSWLEDLNDESELQSLLFIYGYSTIDKYLNKSFPIPLTWTLSYAQPIAGKNVQDSRVYFTELQIFF